MRVGINGRGLFVHFDPNDIDVFVFPYNLWKEKKVPRQYKIIFSSSKI